MNKYFELWKNFKKNHRNLHILFISISIVAWFRGMTGIIDYYIIKDPNNITMLFILVFVALLFLYLDDFSLIELYNPGNINKINNAAASAVQASVYPNFS